ncbi:MAG: signal peptidase I [Pseudomonadota bacterium]
MLHATYGYFNGRENVMEEIKSTEGSAEVKKETSIDQIFTDVASKKKKGKTREFIEGVLLALLIAGFLRSFVFEAYKIPSASMTPTLLPGDHIFVNKFIYGPRIPFTKIRLFDYKKPKRGEVMVFMYPEDESINFIKRVIGLPGDKVVVDDTNLYINGELIPHEFLDVAPSEIESEYNKILLTNNEEFHKFDILPGWDEDDYYLEKLDDINHITHYRRFSIRGKKEFEVPEGHYFVMGDNRDDSRDSREWGFVPEENVKGRAMFIWFPLDKYFGGVRWHDFGKWIK